MLIAYIIGRTHNCSRPRFSFYNRGCKLEVVPKTSKCAVGVPTPNTTPLAGTETPSRVERLVSASTSPIAEIRLLSVVWELRDGNFIQMCRSVICCPSLPGVSAIIKSRVTPHSPRPWPVDLCPLLRQPSSSPRPTSAHSGRRAAVFLFPSLDNL